MAGTNAGNPAISGAAWVQPQPQAVLGLSSSMVYGSAFSSSFPLAFQLATGGLFKLIVDPAGYAGMFPDSMAAPAAGPLLDLFGSGIGGNVQMTLGTTANISMGLAYNIHIGETIANKTQNKTAWRVISFIAGGVMAAAAIAFQIAYGIMKRDDDRAALVVAFQIFIQAVLALLMGTENAYYAMDHEINDLLFDIFGGKLAASYEGAEGFVVLQHMAETLVGAAVTPGVILPPILESVGEGHLDQVLDRQPSDPNDPSTDGSGAYMSVPKTGVGS